VLHSRTGRASGLVFLRSEVGSTSHRKKKTENEMGLYWTVAVLAGAVAILSGVGGVIYPVPALQYYRLFKGPASVDFFRLYREVAAAAVELRGASCLTEGRGRLSAVMVLSGFQTILARSETGRLARHVARGNLLLSVLWLVAGALMWRQTHITRPGGLIICGVAAFFSVMWAYLWLFGRTPTKAMLAAAAAAAAAEAIEDEKVKDS
jgi:hypothetical protein